MGLIIAILLGALVGWLAAYMFGRREGFLASVAIGVFGALLGNVISGALGQGGQSALSFDLSGLLWSLAGAVVVVMILNVIQGRNNTPSI